MVELFRWWGETLINHNSIHEEINKRLNSRNACYHSVQNHLSSILLSKHINIKTYRTVIFLLFCMGVELGLLNRRRNIGWEGQGRWQVWGTGEVNTGFKCGGLRKRVQLGNLGIDGWINNKIYVQEVGVVDMDWIVLAEEKKRRRELGNALVKLQVQKDGEFLE